MATARPSNSTIVRSSFNPTLVGLRLSLGLGSLLAPQATARRAASLFSTPFPGSRERALQADLAGARLEPIEVDGETVTLYHWGEAATRPRVLFSHGWSSFGLRIGSWIPALREAGFAVTAFDQIAHGRSSGQRATLPGFGRVSTAVARHLGPLHTVIGHSLGGAASAMALAEGVSAQRAVLIAPAADALSASARFADKLGLRPQVLREMRAEFTRRVGVPFDALSAQEIAPRLSQPALIVHDLEDAEVPWEEGERYARYWPNARLLSTRGLGHHRIVSAPQVIDAALRFMAGESVGDRVVSTAALPYGLA